MPKLLKDINPATRRVPYSRFWWNEKAQRYIGSNGKFVSPQAVRDIIDDNIAHAGDRMVAMAAPLKEAAQQLQDGKITHDEYILATKGWRDAMIEGVRNAHFANGMAAKGGFHNMTDADADAVQNIVAGQAQFLNVFAAQSAMYPDYVLSGEFNNRVKMYAETARGTYEQFATEEGVKEGFIYIENILEAGVQHCTGKDSCIEMTQMGKVLADDPLFLMPTRRICGPNCKCGVRRTKE